MIRRICCIILVLLFAVTSAVNAEIIRGRFIDAETKEALEGVDLLCTGGYKRDGKDIRYGSHIATDSLGRFLFFSNISGKITAKLIGYYPKEINYIAISENDRDTVDLGDIKLKVSEVMMKALLVKERARRFTLSGDTIVFHPEAFHLEKGARLEELIAQLPGVEVNGNSLYFNGKPIRVVMNGESLFGNSGFYKELPAEAVETIKAYNKASEFSERTGKDDGSEDMVLDLKIKKSFLDKFYGDVKGAYQTPKHYDAEATVHRLSESNPVMITASANDLSKQRRQTMSSASANMSKDFGQEQYGAAGYQHNWKRTEGGQTLKSSWAVSGGMAHDDRWSRTRRDTEDFFPGETYNYTTTSNYQRNHALNPNAEASFRNTINTKNTVSVRASIDHKRLRTHSDNRSARFDRDPYATWQQTLTAAFDSQMLPGMLLRNRTQSTSEGHSTNVSTSAGWTHYIKDGSLSLNTSFNYSEALHDKLTERLIEHFTEDGTSTTLHQSTRTPTNNLTTLVTAAARKWVHKKVLLNASYSFNSIYEKNVQDFYENNIRNDGNSYDERYVCNSHTIRFGSTININTLQLMPSLSWKAVREHEDYVRGRLDTVATRHALFLQPQMQAKWKTTKTSSLELDYSFRTSQPNIIDAIHYRDDSDPLYIREGNPNLRNTHTNNLTLTYNVVATKQQRMINLSANFTNSDRAMQYVQDYNPQTNVYTLHPEMVQGGRQGTLTIGYDQGLGNEFRLKNNLSLRYGQSFGYLTRTDENEDWQLNRCNNFSPSENLTLSYDHLWLKCSVFTFITVNHLRYSQSPQQNSTLWNNRVGANVTMEWKYLTIASNLTECIRRGYLASGMNDNYLLWNASATLKLWNNKARLRVEVDDILNQFDTFYAQQGAYQNIYSWRDQMHHFINISFTYHFDAKEK